MSDEKRRCINAFMILESGEVYAGGVEVDANDPVLEKYAANFAPVATAAVVAPSRVERATAGPDELRQLSTGKRRPGRPRKNPVPPVVEPEPVIEPEAPVVEPEPVTEEN